MAPGSSADTSSTRRWPPGTTSPFSTAARPEAAGYTENATLLELDDPTVEVVTGETYGNQPGLDADREADLLARWHAR